MLGNFVWDSLVGDHRHLSQGVGGARRYLADVSPFAALRESTQENLIELAGLVKQGELVYVREDIPVHNGEWKLETQSPALQMILRKPSSVIADSRIRSLSTKDVPQMLELTQLVLPGYFKPRSIEMGSYFGLFEKEKLIAMTGERMFPRPYREITAVCTHPAFQGRGLAALLVQHVASLMQQSGLTPFLHTGVGNSRAIALYRRLGFEEVCVVPLNGLRRLL